MPVPNNITDLDTDPINNSPPGTESAKGNIDNYLRAAFAFIRQLYNSIAANDALVVHKSGAETITGDKTLSGAKIIFAKGADIASAATVNLSTATGNSVNLTGTTAVTAWIAPVGTPIRVNFTAATPITYNSVTNRLQGGSSITGEVGSYLIVYYDGTTTFVDYILGSGAAASGPSYTTVPAAITATGATLTNNAVGVPTKVNSATATTTTLMAVSTLVIGQSFTLSNIGAGVATFNRVGGDTINGNNLIASTSIVLNQGESVTLTCDSANSLLVTASNVSFFGAKNVAQVTTSGTAFDFPTPKGTTYFEVALDQVSLSGTDDIIFQLSTGGVFTVAGYLSTSGAVVAGSSIMSTSAAGLIVGTGAATNSISGTATFTRISGNTWDYTAVMRSSNLAVTLQAGRIAMAGEVDAVRLTRSGVNTFDAGQANTGGFE